MKTLEITGVRARLGLRQRDAAKKLDLSEVGYMKSKGGAVSQRFFDCMNELIEKVKKEEAK